MSLGIAIRLHAVCNPDYTARMEPTYEVDKTEELRRMLEEKNTEPTYCVDPVEYAISQLKRSHK
jgi:hypothetical protein